MDSRKHSGIQPAKLQALLRPQLLHREGGSPQKFTEIEVHLRTQRLKERRKKTAIYQSKIKNAKYIYPLRWLHFLPTHKTTWTLDMPLPETLPQASQDSSTFIPLQPWTGSMAKASPSPSTHVCPFQEGR